MRSTRVDIEYTQGDDVGWLVKFVDAAGDSVDMGDYTFAAWIKQWTGGPVISYFTPGEDELSSGRLLLALDNQSSQTGHVECVWTVHITHVPSSVDWDLFSGKVLAQEFATGGQTTELVVTLDPEAQVIQVVVGAIMGPPGPGSGTSSNQVEDQIVDGVVDKAPSQNAVFGALVDAADDASAVADTLVSNHESKLAPAAHVAFRFDQTVPADTWTIQHNLGTYPAVSVVIGGAEVEADVQYVDSNQIIVAFLAAHTGSVFLN